MKSKLLTLFTIVLVGISSCYDDSDLRTQLEDHEQRISALETLCNQLNCIRNGAMERMHQK